MLVVVGLRREKFLLHRHVFVLQRLRPLPRENAHGRQAHGLNVLAVAVVDKKFALGTRKLPWSRVVIISLVSAIQGLALTVTLVRCALR